jgi:hypothetical protein
MNAVFKYLTKGQVWQNDQKLDILIDEIKELKALLQGHGVRRTAAKKHKQETKEEIANRLLAKIRVAAEPGKAD